MKKQSRRRNRSKLDQFVGEYIVEIGVVLLIIVLIIRKIGLGA